MSIPPEVQQAAEERVLEVRRWLAGGIAGRLEGWDVWIQRTRAQLGDAAAAQADELATRLIHEFFPVPPLPVAH